jgi:phosphoribosylformylglycinamidine synthase
LNKLKALVLTGYGINCDYETTEACERVGFLTHRLHLNDIITTPGSLFDYRLVVFPGGFSFGDDLGSGVAFSSKIRFSISEGGKRLYNSFMEYIERDGLVLGICNGFQILVRLGLIPAVDGQYGEQQVTLAPNREGYFIDRWVKLRAEEHSPNIFTTGKNFYRLPVRHGEGRFITMNAHTLKRVEEEYLVSLRYCDNSYNPTQEFPHNPNGSQNGIAGVCDPSGRVFGLMPHPEAAMNLYQYPDWTKQRNHTLKTGGRLEEKGDGYALFSNAFEYVK